MNHPNYLNNYPSHVVHPERVKEMKAQLPQPKLELVPMESTKYDVETVNQVTPEPEVFNWNDMYSRHD